MPPIFEYLLKLSLSLIAIYGFYQLVLRRLTFYNWNRWYLLGYSLLSFIVAFIDLTPLLQQHALTQNRVLAYIPSVQNLTAQMTGAPEVTSASAWTFGTKWDWMLVMLIAGMILLITRLILSLLSIRRIRRSATLVSQGNMQLYLIDQPLAPFSFGNGIYINKQLHSESELQDIISHEFVHVKQQHTVDIIVGELLCILNWYNPCAWLLRRAIRQNLEFIADRQVIQSGIDRKQYQYLLLKVMGNKNFSIANNFNFSSLKKRIAMMNKMRSARMHLIRFFFLLPLLTVLLLAFRSRQVAANDGGLLLLNTTVAEQPVYQVSDTIVPPGKSDWNPPPTESQKDFIRRHPAVERIAWGYMTDVRIADGADAETKKLHSGFKAGDLYMTDGKIADADDTETKKLRSGFKPGDMFMIIYFKNGKWDMYNVNNEESVSKFRKNYGELPPQAPPPPASASKGTVAVTSHTGADKKDRHPAASAQASKANGNHDTFFPSSAPEADKMVSKHNQSKRTGFRFLAADSLIWSSDKNTLTLMGNAMAMDEATETVLKSDAIVLRQSNLEKVYVDGKSLASDDLHLNPQRHALRMQTLTAGEATRRYGIDFTGTVLEITTEKLEDERFH